MGCGQLRLAYLRTPQVRFEACGRFWQVLTGDEACGVVGAMCVGVEVAQAQAGHVAYGPLAFKEPGVACELGIFEPEQRAPAGDRKPVALAHGDTPQIERLGFDETFADLTAAVDHRGQDNEAVSVCWIERWDSVHRCLRTRTISFFEYR